jgi:hypothetical protein
MKFSPKTFAPLIKNSTRLRAVGLSEIGTGAETLEKVTLEDIWTVMED